MECEICGREIFGKARRMIIDGARLFACPDCAQFTVSSRKPRLAVGGESGAPPRPSVRRPSTIRSGTPSLRADLDLVEDYSQKIRSGRERFKLSHEELSRKIGIKISILQKFETGKMIPDQVLAKQLERFLKIRILQPAPKIPPLDVEVIEKPATLTLGDVAFIQEKKEFEGKRGQ